MTDTDDVTADPVEEPTLSDRLLDLFVFLPTGVVVTVADELPRLAERGRERLGVHVNSARAVGEFAVTAGGQELKRRSAARTRTGGGAAPSPAGGRGRRPAVTRLRTIPHPEDRSPDDTPPAPAAAPEDQMPPAAAPVAAPATAPTPTPRPDAHVPDVASLAIPGFDTLSASQVVQRLDGLSRSELVAVRAYETSTRGRRTILSRVDQLLDERS